MILGAAHFVMPESLLNQLRLIPIEYRPYTIAEGSEVKCGYGVARTGIEGREFPSLVIFGTEGQFLLGGTPLQIFNMMVDPSEG